LEALDARAAEAPLVLEIGTGTGCIALSLASEREGVRVIATDLSSDAVRLATRNRDALGLAGVVDVVECDLAAGVPDALMGRFDLLVSNPPYIPTADIASLSPEVRREPFAALDGGDDGLLFYRAILRDYAPLVKPGGCILLEIGYDQADALRALAAEYLPNATVDILRDLGGNDRVTKITLPTA
jgi:release factor glutamine methyltransferase